MNLLKTALLALLLLATCPAQALVVLAYHDIRDDVAAKGDADAYAVSTANFTAQLDWLQGHGYTPVSVQQVIDARAGRGKLPERAVLLTFDDGLRSVYTRVFPLLRAYGYPALVAPVTGWVDLPQDQQVNYGPREIGHEGFVTWEELQEMQDSGLVEIGSHSQNLHRGLPGNPQGNQTPAAVTRVYATGHYETQDQYLGRVRADLQASRDAIATHLGNAPRVMVWPYAAYNSETNGIASQLGMTLSFDLEGRSDNADLALQGQQRLDGQPLGSLGRLLLFNNPDVTDLARELRRDLSLDGMRAMQVDLDYVYDPDPAQTERNLDKLVQRVRDIGPSHVFLQAFADPDGDGAADAVYFPNRHMPMRADLFNRVAWQLRTRAGVKVFAWLPVLGWKPPAGVVPNDARIGAPDPKDIPRLDPRRPQVQQLVQDAYEDLAANAHFDGLLFHDDAYLRDDELPDLAGGDPAARTKLLIDFTQRLTHAAQRWQPRLVTVRNLFAEPVLRPESEAWFAQRLDAFLGAYDYTALMAMPQMEKARNPERWMQQLVDAVKTHPKGLQKTLFELQTVDWRSGKPIAGKVLQAQVRALTADGVRHIGYYPDDFLGNQPALDDARAAMSARQFPYLEP
jgi:biofilm PGA synthesis lipoprotein PgaB